MILSSNTMIFDTETVGELDTPFIHDIAYNIVNKQGDILCTREFLIGNIRVNTLLRSEFYRKYTEVYNKRIENEEVDIVTWSEFCKIMLKDIRKHKVKVLSAYNLAFDYKALKSTCSLCDNDTLMKKIDKMKFLCLWENATELLKNDDDFKSFCYHYEYVSTKGNILSNAETVYKYISNNLSYVHQHTALEDVKSETEIYKWISTQKGKASYGLKYSCWQKVQPKKEKKVKKKK